MDYTKIYLSLIEKAQTRTLEGYCEVHHIVPRCMGGSDEPENLVRLTPEEHYLAHQLLVKIHPKSYALVKAAAMMIPSRPSNKLYGWLRRKLAVAQSLCQSGTRNSQYNTKWITNGVVDKKVPKEFIPGEGWEEGRKSRIIRRDRKKLEKAEKASQKKVTHREKIQHLRELYRIYCTEGFEGVLKTGYDKSQPNLVSHFARHLPEFTPQNGKKRGN